MTNLSGSELGELKKLESRATKAPWQPLIGAVADDTHRCAVVAERGKLQYLVATIENGAPGDFCETEEANAHLIAQLRNAAAELITRAEEGAELEATFDLRWKADMRAIERWRAAGEGRELTLPDHADLCVWLLGRLIAAAEENERLRNALTALTDSMNSWDGGVTWCASKEAFGHARELLSTYEGKSRGDMKLLHTDCDCCERAHAIIERKDAALRAADRHFRDYGYKVGHPARRIIASALTPATETGETK